MALKNYAMALKSYAMVLECEAVAPESQVVALSPLSALPFMLSFMSFTSCVILPNSERIILHSLSKIFSTVKLWLFKR